MFQARMAHNNQIVNRRGERGIHGGKQQLNSEWERGKRDGGEDWGGWPQGQQGEWTMWCCLHGTGQKGWWLHWQGGGIVVMLTERDTTMTTLEQQATTPPPENKNQPSRRWWLGFQWGDAAEGGRKQQWWRPLTTTTTTTKLNVGDTEEVVAIKRQWERMTARPQGRRHGREGLHHL